MTNKTVSVPCWLHTCPILAFNRAPKFGARYSKFFHFLLLIVALFTSYFHVPETNNCTHILQKDLRSQIMDLAEALKEKFCSFYKKKTDSFGTLKDRIDQKTQQRKITRLETLNEKRNIDLRKSLAVTSSHEPTLPKPSNFERLELLAKWKAEKEKRMLIQKQNQKPVFKVTHVVTPAGLSNVKGIKGKPVTSKFAPPNYEFKPPSNIKPIFCNGVGEKTPQHNRRQLGIDGVFVKSVEILQNSSTRKNLTGREISPEPPRSCKL